MGLFTSLPPDHKSLGTALTEAELCLLGAIVAHWAMTEKIIRLHVFRLRTINATTLTMAKAPRDFKQLRRLWREVTADVLATHPKYRDTDTKLESAAQVLKEQRDSACHWPALSPIGIPRGPIRFRNIEPGETTPHEFREFTGPMLNELRLNIWHLGKDIGFFTSCVCVDLFPSQCIFHGPKPTAAILGTRRIPTIEEPPRRHPSSRG